MSTPEMSTPEMSTPESLRPAEVIAFWMEAGPAKWFAKSDAFDDAIRTRFGDAVAAARDGLLDGWAQTREGRLALILLLDQFSRNIHRGSPLAFAGDERGLALARAALDAGDFDAWPKEKAQWILLPFEHHEGLPEQDMAVELAKRLGDAELLKYAELHRDIIRDFGRFPHRNVILGRRTTPDEQAFLDEGGFAG